MDPITNKIASGAAGAGGAAAGTYVEDVFSTYLYTGNDSTQTITNGIDLAGEGGLVWIKCRSATGGPYTLNHILSDTARGIRKALYTNEANAQSSSTNFGVSAYNSDGFSLNGSFVVDNSSVGNYASWTFRKAPKFFDVVTYTGTGVARTVAHNLGSVPGCIIVKRLDTTANWQVYHRGLTSAAYKINLDNTNGESVLDNWNSTDPTSTVFSLGTTGGVNGENGTYVAYLFAHDAGGFGDDGTESVIECGSFTSNGSYSASVSLGWEPQWLMIKRTDTTGDWAILDNMRGVAVSQTNLTLVPNSTAAEGGVINYNSTFNSTGFSFNGSLPTTSASYVYIAIRRGPMKTPTDATEVFKPETNVLSAYSTAGFPVDHVWGRKYSVIRDWRNFSRLIGTKFLVTNSTNSEGTTGAGALLWDSNTGFYTETEGTPNVWYQFRRAPGFFDVVTYTGTGVNRTISHNLGVAPELLIVKGRNSANQWITGSDGLTDWTKYIQLSQNAGESTFTAAFNSTAPTATVFSIGNASTINGSGNTYIAYLFATCPGVSKVGSYTGTGTGTTLDVNCGFSAGARFVLIKRTDNTGDWYVWDTARGIVNGNDPSLLLNSNVEEVTDTDYIDPLSSGFQISSTAPTAINSAGGSYIFLAIA